jgi:hypothetical protein
MWIAVLREKYPRNQNHYIARRFSALVLPRWLSSFDSNESFWPSLSEPMPARHIVAAVVRLNEAEAFCRVEPLNCSGSHFTSPRCAKARCAPHDLRAGLDPISAMSWGVEPVRRDQQGKRLFEWAACTPFHRK